MFSFKDITKLFGKKAETTKLNPAIPSIRDHAKGRDVCINLYPVNIRELFDTIYKDIAHNNLHHIKWYSSCPTYAYPGGRVSEVNESSRDYFLTLSLDTFSVIFNFHGASFIDVECFYSHNKVPVNGCYLATYSTAWLNNKDLEEFKEILYKIEDYLGSSLDITIWDAYEKCVESMMNTDGVAESAG